MVRKKMPPLSRAETEVLTLLWDLGRGTVQDIWGRLPKGRHIASATVQTLLRRLEKKGYVVHETQGKAHVFLPTARREDVVRKSVADLVDQLFDGDVLPLVLHLVDQTRLSEKDIEQLKSLLDDKTQH